MYYDQKIKYLEMRERGEKIKGAGFVKLECWGKNCNILIQLSCMGPAADGEREWFIFSNGKSHGIGKMEVVDGRGRLELRDMDCEDVAGSGFRAQSLGQVCMPLPGGREVVCVLNGEEHQEKIGQKVATSDNAKSVTRDSAGVKISGTLIEAEGIRSTAEPSEVIPSAKPGKENGERALSTGSKNINAAKPGEENGERARSTGSENINAAKPVEENGERARSTESENINAAKPGEENGEIDQGAGSENILSAEAMAGIKKDGSDRREASVEYGEKSLALKEQKWDQLREIYPKVAPFGDKRRYLKITPGDFVILKEKSYRRANNSFLLHGFFTYKHLILHKELRKGEEVYFVGVPGQFFDQEKEVAILFGFESFEGGREPAKEGDFGYYMMRVEL